MGRGGTFPKHTRLEALDQSQHTAPADQSQHTGSVIIYAEDDAVSFTQTKHTTLN